MVKKTSKSKGPRGKKARAKAKLERQWGEEDVGKQKVRSGKSRLLRRKSRKDSCTAPKEDALFEDDSQVEENQTTGMYDDDESDDEEEQACSKLLQTLRKRMRSDSSGDSRTDDSQDKATIEADAEVENAMEVVDNTPTLSVLLDPFSQRFFHAPLSDDDTKRGLQMLEIQTPLLAIHSGRNIILQASKSLKDKLELSDDTDPSQLKARSKALIQSAIRKALQNQSGNLSPNQNMLFPFLSLYADMLVTLPGSHSDDTMYALHILNHVLTNRSRIQRHNRQQQALEPDTNMLNTDHVAWQRDQGYARPTVLVLLPTKGCCFTFVKKLKSLLDDSAENDRFESEYGPPSTKGTDLNDPAEKHRRKALSNKGKEWLELFGDDVNDDDDFKIGLAVEENKQKKRNDDDNSFSIKLFTDFYRSDIILASPLGLKMNTNTKEDGDSGFEYLSSIEICFVSRGDVLLMQNWDHLNDLLPLLNQQPKDTSNIDFSRVREYFLGGQAAHWRQLIVTSSFLDPVIVNTFKRYAKSIAGMVRVRQRIDRDHSSVSKVLLPTQQVFQRVHTTSLLKQSEDRVTYFTEKVLPQVLKRNQKHTMIFIPSYFDFVAVRNILLKQEKSFVMVNEYSRHTETSRARARFLQGRKPLLLYTGRAHFFYRHLIKGARHVIFLGLPEYPAFYSEIVNYLNEGLDKDHEASASCLALFTKYEAFALERIIGSENSKKMIQGDRSTFLFT
jgi:U3 small nucleolar RNA-associated protein 25